MSNEDSVQTLHVEREKTHANIKIIKDNYREVRTGFSNKREQYLGWSFGEGRRINKNNYIPIKKRCIQEESPVITEGYSLSLMLPP